MAGTVEVLIIHQVIIVLIHHFSGARFGMRVVRGSWDVGAGSFIIFYSGEWVSSIYDFKNKAYVFIPQATRALTGFS